MQRDEPFSRECCFGLLHRKTCLIIWACIKIIVDIGFLIFLLPQLFLMMAFRNPFKDVSIKSTFTYIIMLAAIILVFFDIVWKIALIVGLAKKYLRTIKMFYYYTICMAVLYVGIMVIITITVLISGHLAGISYGDLIVYGSGIAISLMDLWVICALKGEMTRIINKQQRESVPMVYLKQEDGTAVKATEFNV